jgi:hypothetical protein
MVGRSIGRRQATGGNHSASFVKTPEKGTEQGTQVYWLGLSGFHFHLAAHIGYPHGAYLQGTALDGVGFRSGGGIVGRRNGARQQFQPLSGIGLKDIDQLLHQNGFATFLQLLESRGQNPRVGEFARDTAFHTLAIKVHKRTQKPFLA